MTNAGPPVAIGHAPVLLDEVVHGLQPHDGGRYLDATFGGGGHTTAILRAAAPSGRVLAIDADPDAVARGRDLAQQPEFAGRFTIVHSNFEHLERIVREAGFDPLDGVLIDLGLSSFQLDSGDRGFAFRFDGPLDMRFDPTHGSSARDLVNEQSEERIADVIWRFGDEHRSRRIASAIVRERLLQPIETTGRLASIVERAVGGRRGSDTHPATRTFQALRIAVNDELSVLESALEQTAGVLAPGGRLVVIAFHSLEDRIVKQFIHREAASCICPPEQPICTCKHVPRLKSVSKPIRASAEETKRNPRSRSAVLRIAERLPASTTEVRP